MYTMLQSLCTLCEEENGIFDFDDHGNHIDNDDSSVLRYRKINKFDDTEAYAFGERSAPVACLDLITHLIN